MILEGRGATLDQSSPLTMLVGDRDYEVEVTLTTEGPVGPRVRLKLRNVDQVATWWTASGEGPWVRHPWQMEVSGLHHNAFGGFTALKVGLVAVGDGRVTYSDFTYQGL